MIFVRTHALLLLAAAAWAADDPNSAAAALARRTVGAAGKGETVAVSWRNVSSLGSADLAQTRTAFESALRDAGGRLADSAGAEAKLSLSENAAQYLLVEEFRKGEERQTWIAAWPRTAGAQPKTGGIPLDRKLVWRQTEQILDAAFVPAGMLVLSPSGIALYSGAPAQNPSVQNNARRSVPIAPSKPWPRDLRGRIHAGGAAFQVFLPGMTCSGNTEPGLAMECRAGDAPWVLESGSRALLLANFAAARNYFDGRIVTQSGARKTLAPFYSAASVETQGRALWLLAQLDGRTQIVDGAFESAGSVTGWGSDVVGVDSSCGPASQVFASASGDAAEPDSIRSYSMSGAAAIPVSAPVVFPGPVTALWPSGGSAALAVAHDLASGDYVAYVVSISCGQ